MNERQLAVLANELTLPAYNEPLAQRNYAAVADTLNARESAPNPTPRGTIPRRIAWNAFVDALTATDALKLYGYGVLADHLRQALEANDRIIMLAIWRGLSPALEPASRTAVLAIANQTEPDPDWTPTILLPSRAMVLGLPVVLPEDCELVDQRLHGR